MADAVKPWRPPPRTVPASDPSSTNEMRATCAAGGTTHHLLSASVPPVQSHPAALPTHSASVHSKQQAIYPPRGSAEPLLLQAARQPFRREASPASSVRGCSPVAEHPRDSSLHSERLRHIRRYCAPPSRALQCPTA